MQRVLKWFFVVVLWSLGLGQAPALVADAVALEPAALVAMVDDGGPEAQVLENEFDFGEMTEDGTYVHEFRIINSGTGVLELTRVMPA
jgi:hypothetical protein